MMNPYMNRAPMGAYRSQRSAPANRMVHYWGNERHPWELEDKVLSELGEFEYPTYITSRKHFFDEFGYGNREYPSPYGLRDVTDLPTFESERVRTGWDYWRPRCDIAMRPDAIVVYAELPGIPKEHIHVNVKENRITISTEKPTSREFEDSPVFLGERRYGHYFRSLPLPDTVDANRVTASMDHGVLRVFMPRVTGAEEKGVTVTITPTPTGYVGGILSECDNGALFWIYRRKRDRPVAPQGCKFTAVPVIDIQALTTPYSTPQEKAVVAKHIFEACKNVGFFYITNHGVPQELQDRLELLSREFFTLPVEEKLKIDMVTGGKAWRGYFKVGDELTSGKPDGKEGIYLGEELSVEHPKVKAEVPLHGPNLFPDRPAGLKEAILEYFTVMKNLGHILMRGIALSLDLEEDFFEQRYTNDPLGLFRIFNYPADPFAGVDGAEERWGVGEHTDYGVLTILKQDSLGGLFVKNRVPEWIAAPPIPNSFVINIGDMLEKMTKGFYRSTPHRVKNSSKKDRISFPFFFDPNFDVEVKPLPLSDQALKQVEAHLASEQNDRWDKANVHSFTGTYLNLSGLLE